MEVVKSTPLKPNKKKEEKLKGLLFKKQILEKQIQTANIGATITTKYYEAIEAKMKELPEDSLEYKRLDYEKMKIKREASDFISDFKEFRRNYEEGVLMEIQQTLEREEFNEIPFHYIEEQAQKLAQHELYGKIVVKPKNIELSETTKELERYIDILKVLNTEIQSQLENDKGLTAIDKIRLEKELFDNTIHLQNLEKRYSKVLDYYVNQFLPVYEEDMKECEQNLSRYLEIAKKIDENNIDFAMKAMLSEYEKHKDDSEHLWLFYTALRERLKSIAKAVGRNRKKYAKIAEIVSEFLN